MLEDKAYKQICDSQQGLIDIMNDHIKSQEKLITVREEQVEYLKTHIGELNKIIDEYRVLLNGVVSQN